MFIEGQDQIKIYRLPDAADLLANDKHADLLQLALDLGYFDQAHFIKNFKTIIGTSPGEYSKTETSV